MKIVIDDKIPYIKGVLEPFAEVVYLTGSKISNQDLIDADALFTRTRTKCNAELLKGTSIKFIATATIGYDHIDTRYCESNGIYWTNAPGCNSSSVQQYIASALTYLAIHNGFKLSDKKLGVVGVGNVGSKVVALAKTLGMQVLMNDPPRARKENNADFVPLETILKECDIITFHVPLNKDGEDKTVHLADTSFFNKMRPGTIIINSSRGEVVDNKVLKEIIKQQKTGGCVLDVWEGEPNLDEELLQLVDIGTPHIAGYSYDGKANGTAMSVQAFSRFFKLGIDNWYPSKIETPNNTLIDIDCSGKSNEEIIYEVFSKTYDIKADDQRLRNSLVSFEKQRGDYPLRREFAVYRLKFSKTNHSYQFFKELGFNC